jgi:hypothetical protein
MNLSSQHGSNQSLNLQDQQQQQQHNHLNPSRSSNPNAATYNNESSLLMCATGAYNNAGPNPNNAAAVGGPPPNHHTQNGGLTPSVSTPGSGSYPPAIPSLYANSGNPLSNGGGGGGGNYLPISFSSDRYDLDAHHNLQNLVAMSQVNSGGKPCVFLLIPCHS